MSSITLNNPVGDAEFDLRDGFEEGISYALNAVGTGRNVAGVVQNCAQLLAPTSILAPALGPIVPISQLTMGPMCVVLAARYTIPAAFKELESVEKGDGEGKALAITGLTNQFLLLGMGLLISLCGAIGMASPEIAAVLHYGAILSPAAAKIAALTSSAALGILFIVRGVVILGRAGYSLYQVAQFDDAFQEQLSSKTPEKVVEWIDGHRYCEGKESAAFKRKAGDLKSNPADTKAYLLEVDKGIYTRKLQQIMNLIIGFSMVLGGALLLASVIVSGGATLPIVLGLISGIFFVSIEIVYLNYGSSTLFNWMRDLFYVPSLPLLIQLQKS